MKTEADRIRGAGLLLGPLPAAKELLAAPALPVTRQVSVRVERNFPFEWLRPALDRYMSLWGAGVSLRLSGYDAALPGAEQAAAADVHLLWIDWRKYRSSLDASGAAAWLKGRLEALRRHDDKPILVNNWPETGGIGELLYGAGTLRRRWSRDVNAAVQEAAETVPGCAVIDLSSLSATMGASFWDDRNDTAVHYPFSSRATLAIARHLGAQLLPAVLMPRLKAVALDLDGTLYDGVLGEDGVGGVRLTEAHYRLQRLLLQVKHSGIMLAVISKNEAEDVRSLFSERGDFPLQHEHFAAVLANWRPKSENMAELARMLNIDPSAILFVDDSYPELLGMLAALPSVPVLHADRDAGVTAERLVHFPGMYLISEESGMPDRTKDIRANQIREELRRQAKDTHSYLAGLDMVIRLYVNCRDHARRLFDMSRKTNQFNLALRRMSEAEAERAVSGDGYLTVTVHLSDRLSDSGIVGAFVATVRGGDAHLIEALFSCRALGREVETVAFAYFLERLQRAGASRLSFDVREGPRNAPARQWFGRFVKEADRAADIPQLLGIVRKACRDHPSRVEEMQ
jgi:FkbH-like protein